MGRAFAGVLASWKSINWQQIQRNSTGPYVTDTHEGEKVMGEKRETPVDSRLSQSTRIVADAVEQFRPTHIVSMVSGGKDSACSDAVARELGVKIDMVIHGNTRCGIPETSQFVRDRYGALGEYVEADAGTAYEDYVLRKGFFGKGIGAHAFAYHVLKADPFRKAVSANIRHGKRDIRVLLLNGARKDESENRNSKLQMYRRDPSRPGNIWANIIHDWTQQDRDSYLDSRRVPVNPVAKQLCRSGECMCGTMQTHEERIEAALLYPQWGSWIAGLEAEAIKRHGYGWGVSMPRGLKPTNGQRDLFQPMCTDCVIRPLQEVA